MTAKTPLCAACRETAGWIEDEAGNLLYRCPCRSQVPASPRQVKAAAMKATAEAHETAMKAALLVIRDKAETLPLVSGNDCRDEMDTAGIDTQLLGPAFARAVKLGWLEPEDFVQSTGPSAKGAYLRRYTSKLFTLSNAGVVAS